jgi:glycosyltransferase involved in cell wall biosynthesis
MVVHKYYYWDPRVSRYAEALAEAGGKVDVLSLRGQNQVPPPPKPGINVYAIPLLHGHQGWANLFLEYGGTFAIFTLLLLVLYARNRYQVIHVHNMPDVFVFTALVPRLLGARVILDIHDPMPEVFMSKFRCSADNRAIRLLRALERLSCWFATAVVTANGAFKRNLVGRSIPVSKITVVNNIPDTKVFNRGKFEPRRRSDGDRFTLIYPGTIAPRYGLDVPIRALPCLAAQIPGIRLVIIGHGQEHARELAQLAERLKASAYLEFRPAVPIEEVASQLAQADVGIYAARPDAHMSIATPTKVLEYAAIGIPIVASRLTVLQELFPETAVKFFEPGNVDQFASCVLQLFNDPGMRAELVRHADNSVMHTMSWSTERRAYFDLLNRLLAGGKRPLKLEAHDPKSVDPAISGLRHRE